MTRSAWKNLTALLLFPLRPANLLRLGLLALFSPLALFLPLPAPWALVLVESCIALLALAHGCRIMEQATRGRLSLATQRNDFGQAPQRRRLHWKMALLLLVPALALELLRMQAPLQADAALLGLAAVLPAMLVQLCYSNRVLRSLLPNRWLPHLHALGLGYVPAVLILVALFMLPELGRQLPMLTPATLLVVNFVALYLNLFMLYLLGSLMHARQAELGFSVMPLFEEATTANADEATLDAIIAAHLAAGKMDAAIDVAKDAVRQATQSIPAQERLYTLLLSAGDNIRARQQGERLFALCVAQGHPRALGLYRSLGAGSNAMTATAHQALPLARLAVSEGDAALALEVLRGFDKRFPGHADIPGVYLLSARLLAERFDQRDMAVRILDVLLNRYGDDALAPEAQRYRAGLTR